MEVILLQKVANLGTIGERVKVRSGYGRNFSAAAGQGDPGDSREHCALSRARRHRARAPGPRAAGFPRRSGRGPSRISSLTIHAKAGTEGKLFGSIGTSDNRRGLYARGLQHRAQRGALCPQAPLRMLGEHLISLHLPRPTSDVPLHVTIVAEE